MAASSGGKWPLFGTAFQTQLCKLSVELALRRISRSCGEKAKRDGLEKLRPVAKVYSTEGRRDTQ